MARYSNWDRSSIDALVDRWKRECLIADGSLAFEGELWTLANFEQLHRQYNESLLEDDRSFEEKFREQLANDQTMTRLGAEVIAIYFLFAAPHSVGPHRKLELISSVLGWGGDELPEGGDLRDAMHTGIGGPGQAYNNLRWKHLAYMVTFGRAFKGEAMERRTELLGDAWAFKAWLTDRSGGAERDGGEQMMRQILLHLLFPDDYERIASTDHKYRIVNHLRGLIEEVELDDGVSSNEADVDRALFAIRARIEKLRDDGSVDLPETIDFYEGVLFETWDPPMADHDAADGVTNLDALAYKGQVVLYGPPGTGKTHEAKALAKRLVHHAALKRWHAVAYLKNYKLVDRQAEAQIKRLQLHQAYTYEDFIRGLRLVQGGATKQVDGYLLRLAEEIDQTPSPADGLEPLPWVLILDELNRADVSRLFGEVFSLLEDRRAEIDLPGLEEGEETRRLHLPEDLYVIGTMNLIDQSVEQLDFALRRRFLWIRSGFRRDVIVSVIRDRWSKSEYVGHHPWERLEPEIERLADHAERLNQEIATSPLLGEQYEVGHTYFFDVAAFIEAWDRVRPSGNRPSGYLWTPGNYARPPLEDLWRHSLYPLLHEYLAGVDSDGRREQLDSLHRVLVTGSR